jgi:predicted nucleic acid-binding protein
MPADASPRAYFDSSVFVRSYVVERGTAEAVRLIQEHAVVSSALAPLELAGALRRLRRQRRLSRRQLEGIEARVRDDRPFWTLLDIDGRVLRRAEHELTRGAPLRALDAIHLATALTFQIETSARMPFITADRQQQRAGLTLGLDVVFVG